MLHPAVPPPTITIFLIFFITFHPILYTVSSLKTQVDRSLRVYYKGILGISMLHKIRLIPGLDKQSSDTGAEGKWVNADYTRFRYGFPEKIGGWEQLVSSNLIGAGRDQHTWVDLAGNKYAAIGTNKCLYIYFEGALRIADRIAIMKDGIIEQLDTPAKIVKDWLDFFCSRSTRYKRQITE